MEIKKAIIGILIEINRPVYFDYYIDYKNGYTNVFLVFRDEEDKNKLRKGILSLIDYCFGSVVILKIKTVRTIIDKIDVTEFLNEKKKILEIQYLINLNKKSKDKLELNNLAINNYLSFKPFKVKSIKDLMFNWINPFIGFLPEQIRFKLKKSYFLHMMIELEKEKLKTLESIDPILESQICDYIEKNYEPIGPLIWSNKSTKSIIFYDNKNIQKNTVLRWSRGQIEEVVSIWLKFFLKRDVNLEMVILKDTLL